MKDEDLKPAVCGLLIENGKILSVSRKDDHSKLGMPGGKVDYGESCEDAIIRECFEETGIKVKIDSDLIYSDVIDEYFVKCYQLRREDSNIYEKSKDETGKVEFVNLEHLIDENTSPFHEYNSKAFKYFGILL